MKLTVTIEQDKDSSQKIQTVFSKQLPGLISLLENAEFSVEEVTDPKPEAKPVKRVSKKKSNIVTILKAIKKRKDGINSKELQQETGLTSRIIWDNVYRLKKQNKIEKTEAGMFVAL